MIRKIKDNLLLSLNISTITIPLTIAYGSISGLGVSSAIIGLLFGLGFASLVGETKGMIRTPTASLVLLTALIMSNIDKSGDAKIYLTVVTLLMASIIQFLFGKFKISKYIKLTPAPVIEGVISAIGVLLILKSFKELKIESLLFSPTNSIQFDDIYLNPELLCAFSTILLILFIKKLNSKFPSVLLSILLVSVIFHYLPYNLPKVTFDLNEFSLDFYQSYDELYFYDYINQIIPALIIAITGLLISLLGSIVADSSTGFRHDSDLETKGLGISNFLSALFSGLPIGSNIPVTILNVNSGSSNNISSLFSFFVTIIILYFGYNLIIELPNAAIYGMLIFLGFNLIKFNSILFAIRNRQSDQIILLVTLFTGIFFSITYSLLIGFILATVLFMHKMAHMIEKMSNTGKVDDIVSNHKLAKEKTKGVHVINLIGPLFFGFADRLEALYHNIENVKVLIIDMSNVPFMDVSGISVIAKMLISSKRNNIKIYITGANETIYEQFQESKITKQILEENNFYPRLKSCLKMLNNEL
jgi:sulfate permease, SulP family